jgi:hypothetical protein
VSLEGEDMDGAELAEAVRAATETELDRLGSEKALVAVTGASLDREDVLAAAAASEVRAARTVEAWAADEGDDRAREAFERIASTERDHHERVVARMDAPPPDPGPDALHEHLRGLEGTVERVAAGTVGRPLASSRTLLQVVNFFVNEPDEGTAELFRELRAETEDQVDDGTVLLETVCGSDEEWDRARDAAVAAIGVAYDEYVGTLSGMGVDPKPVC